MDDPAPIATEDKPKRKRRKSKHRMPGKIPNQVVEDILVNTTKQKPKPPRYVQTPEFKAYMTKSSKLRPADFGKKTMRFLDELIKRGKYPDYERAIVACVYYAQEQGRKSGTGWFISALKRAQKRWGK